MTLIFDDPYEKRIFDADGNIREGVDIFLSQGEEGEDQDVRSLRAANSNPALEESSHLKVIPKIAGGRDIEERNDTRKSDARETGVGGIDITEVPLQIKRDGRGVPLPVHLQDIQNINIQLEGLSPVIINVAPATLQHLPFLLSRAEEEAVSLKEA